jgi:hypothetical protein
MQRYLEKVAVKGPNFYRGGVADTVETGTFETRLHCDVLPVELPVG